MKKVGRLSLWIFVNAKDEIPEGSYTVAADIAHGTGASNSVLVVINNRTGEKVAEFASPNIRPEELAKYAIALSKWFHNAFLIWEANGPGRIFGDMVIEKGYRNIYYKDQTEKSIERKPTDIPGFFSTKESKTTLLGELRRAVDSGDFINRSKSALEEYYQYVFLPDGTVAHSSSVKDDDPSGARENHGDRVIADALAWRGAKFRSRQPEEPKKEIFPDSFIYRRNQRQREAKIRDSFW